MFSYHKGDLLSAPVNLVIHQANCFHTMGGGIARVIKEKYPEAYEADLATTKGDEGKVGTFSVSKLTADKKKIVNIYSQFTFGMGVKQTRYDAIDTAIDSIIQRVGANKVSIGAPFQYGSRLGGGNFFIVQEIFRTKFEHLDNIDFRIYVLPNEWDESEPYRRVSEALKA